ncbi:MAG TPA: DUF2059 domain-containing protein [Pseudomonadales bacterium]
MRFHPVLLMCLLLPTHPSWAADAESMASEASVRELLEITQTRNLMDDTMLQMDAFMQRGMDVALGGQVPTPEQKAVLDEMKGELVDLFQREMRWDIMEPLFVDVYRQSFTEQEVAGMIAFYRAPAGQALITKMPLVMQHSMQLTQDILASMMPEIQAIQEKALRKLKRSD